MNAYCPDCETELDQSTGICPACRWDPLLSSAQQPARPAEPEMSLTERYRGTQYDVRLEVASGGFPGVTRGRVFVIVGLLAAAGLYGVAFGVLGMI